MVLFQEVWHILIILSIYEFVSFIIKYSRATSRVNWLSGEKTTRTICVLSSGY
jgi:hypothetical protein